MGEYKVISSDHPCRVVSCHRKGMKQLRKIVDNRKRAENEQKYSAPLQLVRKEMYSGEELRKFILVEKMLLEEARGGYSREDVTRILDGVSRENMSVLLKRLDVHIRNMPWNTSALDILNKPSEFPVRYGKGKVVKEIAEEQWGETDLAGTLETTVFTSCLGIACKTADKIRVLHLVQFGGGSDEHITHPSNKRDALALIRQVTSGAEQKAIFGCLDDWRGGTDFYGKRIPNYLQKLGIGDYRIIGEGYGNRWKIRWDREGGLKAEEI